MLRQSFCQAIGNRFCQDGVKVVIVCRVLLAELLKAKTSRAGKCPDIIRDLAPLTCNEITQAIVRLRILLLCLLSEPSELTDNILPIITRKHNNIVLQTVRSPNSDNCTCAQLLILDVIFQKNI